MRLVAGAGSWIMETSSDLFWKDLASLRNSRLWDKVATIGPDSEVWLRLLEGFSRFSTYSAHDVCLLVAWKARRALEFSDPVFPERTWKHVFGRIIRNRVIDRSEGLVLTVPSMEGDRVASSMVVYSFEQTQGRPLPEVSTPVLFMVDDRLKVLAEYFDYTVRFEPKVGATLGLVSVSERSIVLDAGLADEFSLVHPLTHVLDPSPREGLVPHMGRGEWVAKVADWCVRTYYKQSPNSLPPAPAAVFGGNGKLTEETFCLVREAVCVLLSQATASRPLYKPTSNSSFKATVEGFGASQAVIPSVTGEAYMPESKGDSLDAGSKPTVSGLPTPQLENDPGEDKPRAEFRLSDPPKVFLHDYIKGREFGFRLGILARSDAAERMALRLRGWGVSFRIIELVDSKYAPLREAAKKAGFITAPVLYREDEPVAAGDDLEAVDQAVMKVLREDTP